MDKLSAVEAHLAGKLALPPGYDVGLDDHLMELRRPDGTLVAAFSARGADQAAVVEAAEEDRRTRAAGVV